MTATVAALLFGLVAGVALGAAGVVHLLKRMGPPEDAEFIEVRRAEP